MPFLTLQRLSARGFSAFRRLLTRVGDWIVARPRLAAWIYPTDTRTADQRYRDFNERYFANFHEQERMLADKPRMNFYHTAIMRHIQPGDRVIDLGTGTGILAAFAARRGAAKVYAIDHSEILEHARALAVANEVKNVEFVATHSTAFKLATLEHACDQQFIQIAACRLLGRVGHGLILQIRDATVRLHMRHGPDLPVIHGPGCPIPSFSGWRIPLPTIFEHRESAPA